MDAARIGSLLGPHEFIWGPLWLLILIAMAALIYNSNRSKGNMVRYFWLAFVIKFISSIVRFTIAAFLIPKWGGDTGPYFKGSLQIKKALLDNPKVGFELIFQFFEDYSPAALQYVNVLHFEDENTNFVIKLGGIINLVCFDSYLAITFICTFLAFIGSWLIYKTFYLIYPSQYKLLALAIFFPPTVMFFGTNLYKDSFSIFCLGLLTYYGFALFIYNRFRFRSLLLFIFGAFILWFVKSYILITFLAAFSFFIFLSIRIKIRGALIKRVTKISMFLVLLAIGGAIAASILSSQIKRYSGEAILSRLEFLEKDRQETFGSAYALPPMSFTPSGIATLCVFGFNVSLFRPYPWEIKSLGTLILGLEALPTFLLSLFLIFKRRVYYFFREIFRDDVLIFCFTFAVMFLIITGIFAPTFGALSRYKTPGFPFYLIVLLLASSKKKISRP